MKYKKVKRTNNLVSYSESFIFRARCVFCGSRPCGRVYDLSPTYLSSHMNLFKARMHKKPYSISLSCQTYTGNLIKNCGHYYGSFYPRLRSKTKDFSYYKTMTCHCGKTWWSFKENSYKRSVKAIKPS